MGAWFMVCRRAGEKNRAGKKGGNPRIIRRMYCIQTKNVVKCKIERSYAVL